MQLTNLVPASLRTQRAALTAVLAMSLLGQGCFERRLSAIAPCATTHFTSEQHVMASDQVDLLFMIDDSGSMEDEQASLTGEIEHMVTTLTTGRLEDGRQVAPVRSLHVGVVSSDMGVGPVANTNNCEHGGGDDGRLIVRNQRSFLTFDAATGNAAAFAHDVAALATLGTDGCNYEQPLESILTALSPRAPTAFTAPGYVAPTFRALDGVPSVGHGDELNADFLRPGAVQRHRKLSLSKAKAPTYGTPKTVATLIITQHSPPIFSVTTIPT